MTAFKTPSRLTRALSAVGAVLTTVLVLSSVFGLALHYEQEAPVQAAAAAPAARSGFPVDRIVESRRMLDPTMAGA